MEFFDTNYQYGIKSEGDILLSIQSFFNDKIRRSTSKFAKHDFYDTYDNRYELRTRKNSKDEFPTTVVADDKTFCVRKRGQQIQGKVYCLFKFIDGLFYWEFNEAEYQTFEVRDFCRNGARLKDGKVSHDRSRPHIFIPTSKLKKIPLI